MIAWLMLLVGGLLGSSHCVGMCGGLALAVGSRPGGLLAGLGRQTLYSLGRVFTYAVLGASAGYGGARIVEAMPTVVNLQAGLSVAAGMLLLVQGLLATGVLAGVVSRPRRAAGSLVSAWRRPQTARGSSGPRMTLAVVGPEGRAAGTCLSTSLFGQILAAMRPRHVFLAGIINGFLPCGLVYAYLALAVSSGTLLGGTATMALFGLGTVPVMVAVGCGGTLLSLSTRRHVIHLAAWCVVLTGALTVIRGTGFVQLPGLLEGPGCPMCQ